MSSSGAEDEIRVLEASSSSRPHQNGTTDISNGGVDGITNKMASTTMVIEHNGGINNRAGGFGISGAVNGNGIPIGDGTWELRILVTDLQVERSLRVRGELHVGGLMLKLVEELGKASLRRCAMVCPPRIQLLRIHRHSNCPIFFPETIYSFCLLLSVFTT